LVIATIEGSACGGFHGPFAARGMTPNVKSTGIREYYSLRAPSLRKTLNNNDTAHDVYCVHGEGDCE